MRSRLDVFGLMPVLPLVLGLPLSLLSCRAAEGEIADAAVCETAGESVETTVLVVNALRWSRVDADGVTQGFDLDGEVSSGAGSSGCGVEDYMDVYGNEGIDNVFGSLVPALDLTEFSAVEGLIAQSITSGELLITLEVMGLDEPLAQGLNDDCVDLRLARGAGAPLVGTDGLLLAGQTLDRDPSVTPVEVQGVAIEDGSLVVAPVDVDLPIQVFDREMLFEMKDGAIRINANEDGSYSGYFSGAVDVDYVLSVAAQDGVADSLLDLMEGLLAGVSDLSPDDEGDCQDISIALEFEAIPVYFFDE